MEIGFKRKERFQSSKIVVGDSCPEPVVHGLARLPRVGDPRYTVQAFYHRIYSHRQHAPPNNPSHNSNIVEGSGT